MPADPLFPSAAQVHDSRDAGARTNRSTAQRQIDDPIRRMERAIDRSDLRSHGRAAAAEFAGLHDGFCDSR
jgi:hypothetical protein